MTVTKIEVSSIWKEGDKTYVNLEFPDGTTFQSGGMDDEQVFRLVERWAEHDADYERVIENSNCFTRLTDDLSGLERELDGVRGLIDNNDSDDGYATKHEVSQLGYEHEGTEKALDKLMLAVEKLTERVKPVVEHHELMMQVWNDRKNGCNETQNNNENDRVRTEHDAAACGVTGLPRTD